MKRGRIGWIGSIFALMASCGDSAAGTAVADATGPASEGTVGVSTTSGQVGSSGESPTGGETAGTAGTTDVGITTEVDSGCDFLAFCQFDAGPSVLECDIYVQDCPQGQKCAPWAPDGPDLYAGAHCVPVTGDGQPGEACVATDRDEGLDDCARGSKCWDLDAEQHGQCVALCSGSQDTPACAWGDGIHVCELDFETLALCRAPCDPLQSECGEGMQCVPAAEQFLCVKVSGPLHGQDELCASELECAEGLVCTGPLNVPPACDEMFCCQPYCQLPDGACPDPDQICAQVYEDNPTVGFCSIPPR
jgi:hypothetical protein